MGRRRDFSARVWCRARRTGPTVCRWPKLAGLPGPVVARARAVLDHLETRQDTGDAKTDTDGLFEGLPLFAAAQPVAESTAPSQDVIEAAAHAHLAALFKGHDPDQMTPRQALDFVYDLANRLKKTL